MIFGFHPFRCKPVRPFPAEFLAENRPHCLEAIITGRGAQRTGCFTLFIREMNGEDISISLLILFFQIAFGCVSAKPPRIHAHHIDGRLALDDPFSQLPACTACCRDAKAVPLIQPEIWQIPGRAHNRAAIWCIRNSPVIDFFHPNLSKGRHTGDGRFNMRH